MLSKLRVIILLIMILSLGNQVSAKNNVKPKLVELNVYNKSGSIENYINGNVISFINLKSDTLLSKAEVLKIDKIDRVLTKLDEGYSWGGVLSIKNIKEGYYYPQIKLWNTSHSLEVVNPADYKHNGLGHLSIKIDNTLPNSPSLDLSNWSKHWDQGGLNSDKHSPQINRFGDDYVISDASILISGKAEKNQRVEIFVNDSYFISNILNEDCKRIEEDKVTHDNLVVKHGEICDFNFIYSFTDDGKNNPDGTPVYLYKIKVRTIDKAGNRSDFEMFPSIFHDNQAPVVE